MALNQKELDYKKILISICQERGLDDLAVYILGYEGRPNMAPVLPSIPKGGLGTPKYNITALPEAVCDGCEG